MFRWNKSVDINEPTQKAIIVYDAGREDLLLQVKYEGPLAEFGWLIPVPSLPTVEKGSMQPFYELSQLTQRQLGGFDRAATLGAATKGVGEEPVIVIEVKTVGAYEVAILSAQDAGSLERWLKAHAYSIPEGKTEIIDEYIRKDWYFVAAKINLTKPVAFQRVAGAAPKATSSSAPERNAIRTQLRSGELHPLRISFDTATCIYPLKISAVSGKPSEVSLYVLSAEALLNKFIFLTDLGRLCQRQAEWEKARPQRIRNREMCERNLRALTAAVQLYQSRSRAEWKEQPHPELSPDDLIAISKQGVPPASPSALDDEFPAFPYELLKCQRITPDQIPQCAKELPRLKAKNWYLTKQVRTFWPQEMHDLEFQPATSHLVAALPGPAGGTAAMLLTSIDARAASVLVAACQSSNVLQRINASCGLQRVNDPSLVEPLLTLLKDDAPQVRLNAVTAAAWNWDARFMEPLVALLQDPHSEIRQEATHVLGRHESTNRASAYLALLRDPDPDVQARALDVISQIDKSTIPRADLLRLLGSPRLEVVSSALDLLQQSQTLDFLAQRRNMDPPFPARRDANLLSSAEVAPLTTNQLTMARLMGLNILRQNADAQAVALTLPLLRDTNSIVRNRAFALLRTVSSQDIPQSDPAKWEQWWAANKDTFVAPKPAR